MENCALHSEKNIIKKRIKTPFAQIIARKINIEKYDEQPYFEIAYYDTKKNEICIGYGSFNFNFVYNWLKEEFEILPQTWDNPESECYGCKNHFLQDCEKCIKYCFY